MQTPTNNTASRTLCTSWIVPKYQTPATEKPPSKNETISRNARQPPDGLYTCGGKSTFACSSPGLSALALSIELTAFKHSTNALSSGLATTGDDTNYVENHHRPSRYLK